MTAYGSVRVLAVTLALNVLAFKLCSACRIKHLSKTFAAAKVFDRCLILHAEHSLNASTFSARVTASTLTDPYAVIASAVGTLAS